MSAALKTRLPLKTALITALAWLLAAVFLAPYLEMVITAARPAGELRDNGYLPHHFAWNNFVDVWSKTTIGTNLEVSLLVAGGATLLTLLVALPAAYYTARIRFRGRTAFLLLVLITQMFQPTALQVGLAREFTSLNMMDSDLTLILANAAFSLAFAVWILSAYISSIPAELEEAAMIDGTGRVGALFKVTLPLALPGVITCVIFTFITAWNEFVMGLILVNTPSKQPLTVGIDSMIGAYHPQWNYMFAASLVAIVPVVVLFAAIERHVVAGLTAGSVK
ncbi:carbohydrate ABC transporter permease [Kitasatospora viridis]|uniref:Carbohydrate ABC transporter membrane protein 2 (CUT1 family) n=1 Tax=Kitasatospora viridis TaxID=281105 RepID=A0A561SEM1_9ACTN|nr:carbohydrate ABC transporter permease [Kitasatospora viridis]TWF73309.1 carbohydrate ABC transporter membrane protein 2 (CUT1 family) [Kitasatospora viridis]